jgi:hypothetical protein
VGLVGILSFSFILNGRGITHSCFGKSVVKCEKIINLEEWELNEYFTYDPRLKINRPLLNKEWDMYSVRIQNSILAEWEKIRGGIPDRIAELEDKINHKQDALNHEENFKRSCQLNEEISDLASIINDLWIWFRMTQNVSSEKIHA